MIIRALNSIRVQMGQVSWTLRGYPPARIRRQLGVISRMGSARVGWRLRKDEVWAVSVVRDEADVILHVVDHLFGQGIDRILIADNGSVDGTLELLEKRAASDDRVIVVHDGTSAHFQSEKITWLSHRAWWAGAGWIVPFDADEFWFAKDQSLGDFLRSQPSDVTIVHARFHHMVPVRPESVIADATFTLDATASFPGKVAVRSHPLLEVRPGNHQASRVGGSTQGLYIAHAQYRSAKQVERKVKQGTSAARQTGHDLSWFSPHWEAGARLTSNEIEDVFHRISRGLPEPRIGYAARGPMVKVRPLTWSTWDPHDQVPDVPPARPESSE